MPWPELRACLAYADAGGFVLRGPMGRIIGTCRYTSPRFPLGLVAVLLRTDDGLVLPCWAHELRLLA